ncbi:MAG: tetratricopeptide repeat protein [Ignavibacterium sp.]|jgi:tetratricopeptide (TPR) repeat protein|uniref:tetratricopeptide repeat protein n=1 Tax=Ignavibacterium sp. TaxID=2651167 RepID=UPI0032973EAC
MKKIILFIFLLTNLFARQSDFESRVELGIKQIYNIKFEDAEKTFRSLIADYPNHPAGRFFLAMIDWWKILLDVENESHDEIFFQKLEDVIFQCDKILEKDPDNVDALFFKGGSIGFRGRLRSLRESWLKAADDGREALPIVERASKLDPNNLDVQLGFGIYNYYAAVIPEEYPMIKPLMIFFPCGDKEEGLKQLRNTAFNGKYAKYEARYFLMTIYYRYESNPWQAEEFAKILLDDFPDNPTFQRWLGRIYVRQGKMQLADSLFKDVLRKAEENFYGYNFPVALREANYYVGYNYKLNNELDSAKIYLSKCAEISKQIDKEEESGFLINSILYLAQISEAKKLFEEAISYYEQLLKMRDWGNSHSIAEMNLKRLKG